MTLDDILLFLGELQDDKRIDFDTRLKIHQAQGSLNLLAAKLQEIGTTINSLVDI